MTLFRYYKSVTGEVRRLVFESRIEHRFVKWHPDHPHGVAEIWRNEEGESIQIPENVWGCLKIKHKDSDCFIGWTSIELLKELK